MSTTWLTEHLDDDRVVVADCRWYLGEPGEGRRAYEAGHIPGAVFFDLDVDLSAVTGPGRHPLPDRYAFAATLGSFGVGNDSMVVAYDDRGGAIAARLWWMLRWLGHEEAAILDGGLASWIEAGRGLSTNEPARSVVQFVPGTPLTRTVDRTELEQALGDVTVIDARDPSRYRGDHEPIDPAAGHIPTAINIPTAGNLGDGSRLRSPAELDAIYPDGDAVVYCGSGVTACLDILAMRLAGRPEPVLYPGSWSDWSSSGGPVATGSEP